MDELERIKRKHRIKKEVKKSDNYLNKIILTIILTLVLLISIKSSPSFKKKIYNYIYEDNISFSKINDYYKKYLGPFLPFDNILKDNTKSVFNEKLNYYNSSKYLDGVKLIVDNNYLVPSLKGGLVVYVGEKDKYGNTVIIQGSDGVDIWYCNITNVSVKLYDYVDGGSLIGNTIDDNLYLVFKKDGEVISYEDYI